ncbi:hypothetical protein [Oceanobacter mangrovi]|uniref:hypothetical protein n=1 Tax=Oceanobacter mangrovi TaxID=2862510 RepID=UPI001C8EF7DC|nr:hypothetical protein [Oceanobacter mangrovi]
MKKSWHLTALVLLTLASGLSRAEPALLVIGHPLDQKPLQLNQEQIRNLFMGIPVARGLKPAGLTADNELHFLFNNEVIGLAEARIQSYWAQMKFTGRKSPPAEFSSEQQLLDYIRQTPGAIGYVSADIPLPQPVQILLKID